MEVARFLSSSLDVYEYPMTSQICSIAYALVLMLFVLMLFVLMIFVLMIFVSDESAVRIR